MRKYILLIGLMISVVACQQKTDIETIDYVNGYWEIEEVKTPESQTKMYGENTTIDYIEIKDSIGFRQKLMPQLDGKYLTNELKETLQIEQEGNAIYLNCQTDYAQWREEIVALDSMTLILKNSQNIIYKYKRFESLSVNINE